MSLNRLRRTARYFLLPLNALILLTSIRTQSECAQQTSHDNDTLPVVTAALSIDDAISLGDRDNVQIAQARADISSANASESKAKSAVLPSLSATTYTTTGNESSIVTSSPGVDPQNIFNVPRNPFADEDVTVMFPLTTGGTLERLSAAAANSSEANQSDLAAVLLTVSERITELYVNVLLQEALLNSAQSALTEEEEQVRITEVKVSTGSLAPVDLLREQAELALAQSTVTQSEMDTELSKVDLKNILGVSQTSVITLSQTLDQLSSSPPDALPVSLTDAIQTACKLRPELLAVRQREDAAKADVSAARGEYAPQIYVVGMADASAGQAMSGQLGYTVGLTTTLPLYDGGERKSDIDMATAGLVRAQLDEKSTRVQIEDQVSKDWFKLSASSVQLTAAQAGLIAARQGYVLANLRYNAGKSTTIERLDALNTFVRAQALVAEAQAGQFDERSDLLAEIGSTL
jgi:outer membrane protein TolC